MAALGRKTWVIPEGWIPPQGASAQEDPTLVPHETACLLNTGSRDAQVRITIYFADREPVGPYTLTVPARRTRHLRFDLLREPEPVPLGTDFSSVIEADEPIVVQHTRLDSRRDSLALLSTMAWPAD